MLLNKGERAPIAPNSEGIFDALRIASLKVELDSDFYWA